jgi:subtilase family serine protease
MNPATENPETVVNTPFLKNLTSFKSRFAFSFVYAIISVDMMILTLRIF